MDIRLDEARFRELVEESRDLHGDAMRGTKDTLAEIVEAGHEERRRGMPLTLAAAGGLGALLASPAYADDAADVAALQTAASLENLAVATYGAALTLPFVKNGNPVVKTFAETTMKQHSEHGAAFNAAAKELGGKEQKGTNPKYQKVVDAALPGIKGPLDVVNLAVALEDVATSTYVANVGAVGSPKLRTLFASVAGVESQHLATLLAVQALLKGGAPQLIALPPDAAKLPAAAGSVGFPEPFKKTDKASPADEGAVK